MPINLQVVLHTCCIGLTCLFYKHSYYIYLYKNTVKIEKTPGVDAHCFSTIMNGENKDMMAKVQFNPEHILSQKKIQNSNISI